MFLSIRLCKPHFHRFVAFVTTRTHHSPKCTQRVVHAPAHQGQLLHKKLNCLSDGALLALAFGILSAKALDEEMCPWDSESERLPTGTAPLFQPALTAGCQPPKLGLSAILSVLLPSVFSQVPQVSPSSHLFASLDKVVLPQGPSGDPSEATDIIDGQGPRVGLWHKGHSEKPRTLQQEGMQPTLGHKKQPCFSTSIYKHN